MNILKTTKFFLITILLIPLEAQLSGQQQVNLSSEYYRVTITGGISTWDYDGIRERDKFLKDTLLSIQPDLDRAFSIAIAGRSAESLIKPYNADAMYIHGVVITEDEEKETRQKHHFEQYRSASENGLFFVGCERYIANTSFRIIISMVTTDRIKQNDLDAILDKQIEIIEKSTQLMQTLY